MIDLLEKQIDKPLWFEDTEPIYVWDYEDGVWLNCGNYIVDNDGIKSAIVFISKQTAINEYKNIEWVIHPNSDPKPYCIEEVIKNFKQQGCEILYILEQGLKIVDQYEL